MTRRLDAQYWDDRYLDHDQMWSGAPNGVLVTELATLAPTGRALDLGCGEGADALWLAERGWQVTAIDISRVAIDRAAKLPGADAVTWTCADITATPPEAGAYQLVNAQYFPIQREPDHRTLRGVLAAVAPGGTLLVVGHDLTDHPPHEDIDPRAFYEPHDVAELLGDEWIVDVDETRPRTRPAPPGTAHVNDTVLRAWRR